MIIVTAAVILLYTWRRGSPSPAEENFVVTRYSRVTLGEPLDELDLKHHAELRQKITSWIIRRRPSFYRVSLTNYVPYLVIESDHFKINITRTVIVFSERRRAGDVWWQYSFSAGPEDAALNDEVVRVMDQLKTDPQTP